MIFPFPFLVAVWDVGGLIKHQGRQRYPAAAFGEYLDPFRA